MVEPATVAHALNALRRVVVALGLDVKADRVEALAVLLADAPEPWTIAALDAASKALCHDTWFRETVRYGGTVTPADFDRMRHGDTAAASVQAVRLYTHREAVEALHKAGPSVTLADLFDTIPSAEPGGKAAFRRKSA